MGVNLLHYKPAVPRRKRHPVAQYFADIWSGIATTYVGMRLTLSYLFSPPFTMRYPEVRPVIPPGHRGLHGYDETKCTVCRLCAMNCPVDCITIEAIGRAKDAFVTRYDVDYSKCLFCNLCAEACPTSCVWLTEKYDLACGSRGACVIHLARPKTDQQVAERKALQAQKDAERKAAQAQREAEAKAKAQQEHKES